MINKLKLILGAGSKHKNVGKMFYSDYFKRAIVVTAYIDNEHWKFRFSGDHSGRSFAAGSGFDYFVKSEKMWNTGI